MLGIRDFGSATLFLYITPLEAQKLRSQEPEKLTHQGIVLAQFYPDQNVSGFPLYAGLSRLSQHFSVTQDIGEMGTRCRLEISKDYLQQWAEGVRNGQHQTIFGTNGIVQRASVRLWNYEDNLARILDENFHALKDR